MATGVFLMVLAGSLPAACLIFRRPEIAIYGYVVLWLFFPKFIQLLPVLGRLPWEGISVFEVFEAIVALDLVIVCLSHRTRRVFEFSGRLGALLWLFLGMVLLTYCYVYFYSSEVLFEQPGFMPRYLNYPTLQMIYAFIFGWACLRYLDTFAKIEPILLLLALSALELTGEVVLLYYGKLVPFLDAWLLDSNNTGRFGSLAFISFDTVGLISILNICCVVYFLLSRRRPWLLVAIPLLLLPIIGTLAKAPLSGALLSLAIFVSLVMRRHRVMILGLALMILSGTIALESARFANLSNIVNGAFGGAVREDVDIESTFFGRTGLWLRGADIFIHYFPFGVGNGMVEYGMSSAGARHLGQYTSGRVEVAYSGAASKGHITNIHNVFIEIVVENGMMGIGVMAAFLLMLGRNFLRFLRTRPDESSPPAVRMFLAQACVYSALGGMAWRYLYEAGDKVYFLLFLLLYLTYVLPVLARESGGRAFGADRGAVRGDRGVRPMAVRGPQLLMPR